MEDNQWKRRVRGGEKMISRMYSVSPSEGERFYLRLLLTAVKGPKSFEDLRTVNNVLYETFKEAAEARGLCDNERKHFPKMAQQEF
jgi:hypothetical protein